MSLPCCFTDRAHSFSEAVPSTTKLPVQYITLSWESSVSQRIERRSVLTARLDVAYVNKAYLNIVVIQLAGLEEGKGGGGVSHPFFFFCRPSSVHRRLQVKMHWKSEIYITPLCIDTEMDHALIHSDGKWKKKIN